MLYNTPTDFEASDVTAFEFSCTSLVDTNQEWQNSETVGSWS